MKDFPALQWDVVKASRRTGTAFLNENQFELVVK